MITDTIISLFVVVLTPIINLIPSLESVTIPPDILNYLISVFRSIGIFLPVAELMPLLIFIIALTTWRLGYSIICRIKNFIF